MDMNTIALIKGLSGNGGGGGSSLPTDPAQDGTYTLQNTVSSGTGTLSWASGGSSGGVLVVNTTWGDTTVTLDKTWQEIHDAGWGVVNDVDEQGSYGFITWSGVSGSIVNPTYGVTVAVLVDDPITFSAASASDYPVWSFE